MNTKFLDPIRAIYHRLFNSSGFRNSGDYWIKRYREGGNSGRGSYDKFAKFKAQIINDFIVKNQVTQAIEFGCGDGNQCSLFELKRYIGIDISKIVIDHNRDKFKSDPSKEFFVDGQEEKRDLSKIQLALSLDVVYHLVEDEVFKKYMNKLFSYEYVIIYSSNFNEHLVPHVRHRKFTDWVEQHKNQWKLIKQVRNQFPYDPEKPEGETSKADFFIYHNAQMSRSGNS